MTIKTAFIGATTALAIAAASALVPTTASAAPFASLNTTQIETQASGIEQVKDRRHHGGHRGGGRHSRGFNPGAAAAIGVGALALGAIIAAGSAQAEPRRCRIVETERWSNRRQAYIITEETVCR